MTSLAAAEEFVAEYGLPVIIKAAMGGGGKGMRVVRTAQQLGPFYESAASEVMRLCLSLLLFRLPPPRHCLCLAQTVGVAVAAHNWLKYKV